MGVLRRANEALLRLMSTDWIMRVLAIGTLVVVIVTLLAVFGSGGTIRAVRDGDALASCRSSYNAVVVDARTTLDIESSELRRANTRTDNAQIAVTTDAIFNDGANIESLLPELEEAGKQELFQADVVEAAEVQYQIENDRYQEIVNQSREDPESFLATCEEEL